MIRHITRFMARGLTYPATPASEAWIGLPTELNLVKN